MKVVTYDEACENLEKLIERVVDDHEELIIARMNGRSVVLISLEDWDIIKQKVQ